MATVPVEFTRDFQSVIPTMSAAVDLSSTDANLAALFVADSVNSVYFPFARRLYVGVGGTVVGRKYGDSADTTYLNVPSGSYLDGAWIKVVKATTTATNIIAER